MTTEATAIPEAPPGYVLKKENPFNAKWFLIGLAAGIVALFVLDFLIHVTLSQFLSTGRTEWFE